jgi:hypothetical protein
VTCEPDSIQASSLCAFGSGHDEAVQEGERRFVTGRPWKGQRQLRRLLRRYLVAAGDAGDKACYPRGAG